MNIRKAISNDKKHVLKFCQNTFSWGDYIAEVWDTWMKKGILLVVEEKNKPIATCHAITFPSYKQVWIEGIRVNEQHRRKGFAQKLVKKSEDFAKQKNCIKSYMLIESKNFCSLSLAKKLCYKKFQRWNFYHVEPKKTSLKDTIHVLGKNKTHKKIFGKSNFYVDSWRWIPLNEKSFSNLIKKKRIIFSENNELIDAIAIYTESENFDKILMLTILHGTNNGIKNIIKYFQNFAFVSGFDRIQILTPINQLPKVKTLEKKISFYLMGKKFKIIK